MPELSPSPALAPQAILFAAIGGPVLVRPSVRAALVSILPGQPTPARKAMTHLPKRSARCVTKSRKSSVTTRNKGTYKTHQIAHLFRRFRHHMRHRPEDPFARPDTSSLSAFLRPGRTPARQGMTHLPKMPARCVTKLRKSSATSRTKGSYKTHKIAHLFLRFRHHMRHRPEDHSARTDTSSLSAFSGRV